MDATGWLAWIIIGGVAGALASAVTQSRLGIFGDIVVGIFGAFAGGLLFSLVGTSGVTGFNVWSVLVAFIGAVVFLGLMRMLSGNSPVNNP